MLTFDDGYADAYTVVLPLLQKYGFTGVFFVTVNLVGRDGYLTRDQVRALADAGMDVESHAMDHVSMKIRTLADQRYQMCTARQFLSQWTGTDVRHFAYPSGDYNADSFSAAPELRVSLRVQEDGRLAPKLGEHGPPAARSRRWAAWPPGAPHRAPAIAAAPPVLAVLPAPAVTARTQLRWS